MGKTMLTHPETNIIYIRKGVGIIMITRFLLPNTVMRNNLETLASRVIVLVHDRPSQPRVQSYQVP